MANIITVPDDVLLVSGQKQTTISNESLIQGDVVAVTESDANKSEGAQAVTGTKNLAKGIVLSAGEQGQHIVIALNGVVDLGVSLDAGVVYALSATAKKIAPVSDLVTADILSILGWGNADGNLVLNIENTTVAVD